MTKLIGVAALCAMVLASACKGKDKEGDPWSVHDGAEPADTGKPSNDSMSGQDMQEMLKKVGELLEKPGPYEVPEQSADFKDDAAYTGLLALDGGISELQVFSLSSIWGGGGSSALRDITGRLRELSEDKNLTALLLRLGSVSVSLPDAQELRLAFDKFRATGKKIHCHAERLDNITYVVATACDTIALAPTGEVVIPGPSMMPVHLKGLLDRFDIVADFVHIGAYKGAADPLTRSSPSEQTKEAYNAILDVAYDQMVSFVATSRKMPPEQVKAAFDTALWAADAAVAAKLVDKVERWEVLRDGSGAWKTLSWVDSNEAADMVKLMAFVGIVPATRPTSPHVALVYAVGNIEDGGGGGVLGAREVIASETLVQAIRVIAADDNVKAVVLRVDSGGGSALASELIWHEMAALAAKKPLVVSMSDVAASGGYYISAPATRIFALPSTLTGSIGVVGGKIAIAKALAAYGVTTFPMGRGKRAGIYSSLGTWSEDERAAVLSSMSAIYGVFKSRVASGRKKTVEQVEPIAQGRVWTGVAALENGLVDELGGLEDALAFARKQSSLADDAKIAIYPPNPTLRDVMVNIGGVSAGSLTSASQGSWMQMLAQAAGPLQSQLASQLSSVEIQSLRQLWSHLQTFGTVHVQTWTSVPAVR